MSLWSDITGRKATYKQCTVAEYIEACPDKDLGAETGDMFEYSSEPGYDGGEVEGGKLLRKEDLWAVSLSFPSLFVGQGGEIRGANG